MKKTLLLFLILFSISLSSCSDQSKAEKSVTNFIRKFAVNPDSYESVDFSTLEKTERGYEISHGYRIIGSDGQKKVIFHTFKLTEGMNVYVDAFEECGFE